MSRVRDLLVGYFLPAKKLSVTFNPEMSYQARHATLWHCRTPDATGIKLNHPEVLLFCRPKHVAEIIRQAKVVGIHPTHLEVRGEVRDLHVINHLLVYRPSM